MNLKDIKDSNMILNMPRVVFTLGIVSFFMDVSSEMIHPLIPLFLNNVLSASKISIGLIEGIAESTASILKVFSGWLSDRWRKRKPLVFWGYTLSVASRLILAMATTWAMVLIYRFFDRFGKGVRTSPRDALIADSVETKVLGRSFGFHRAMDTLGAVIGPLLAFTLLSLSSQNIRLVFWLSIIPGIFAILTIALFVKERTDKKSEIKKVISLFSGIKEFDKRFKYFLFVVMLFTFGKVPEAFLILRAQELGVSIALIPVIYLVFNTITATLSMPMGIVADRIGKRRIILISYILSGVVYIGFALSTSAIYVWVLFITYGIFVSINEGVQRAFVATLIDKDLKGTGYGIYHTGIGLSALPGGIIAGILYQSYGPPVMFIFSTTISFISSLLLYILVLRKI